MPACSQRLVAGGYDRIFDHVDPQGGGDHRRRLAEPATGQVLEIGAEPAETCPCTATPRGWWPSSPAPACARAQAARAAPVAVQAVDGTAEALPFPNATSDTIVASLVLCTVPDPARALAEARRVLSPGGTLRFYQYVRADDPRLARWQVRLERHWGWLAGGCHPNRDIVAVIAAASFRMVELDRFDFQIMPPLVRPHVLGVAEPPPIPPPRSRGEEVNQARTSRSPQRPV